LSIIRTCPGDVNARLNAAMEYGKKLPASNGKTGVIGFCWGGARSFGYAAAQPALNAAGANLKAAQESWPVVLQFFRKQLQ
jgi:dienelactone hydrolase